MFALGKLFRMTWYVVLDVWRLHQDTPVSSSIVTPPSWRPKRHFSGKSCKQKHYWDSMTPSGHSSIVIDSDNMFLMHFGVKLWKLRLSSKRYQLILWNVIKVSRISKQQGRIDWVILFKIYWILFLGKIPRWYQFPFKSLGVVISYWSCCSLQCPPCMRWWQPKGKLWSSWV